MSAYDFFNYLHLLTPYIQCDLLVGHRQTVYTQIKRRIKEHQLRGLWPFQGNTSFVDHLCFCVLCFSCFRVYSLMHCVHLLGKGWPLGSCCWCLLYFCYFPMWYPGSGVVLDCIVSWSLPSFLLLNYLLTEYYIWNWIKMKIPSNNHCNGNGLVQLIRMGKYILYKWVDSKFDNR